MSNVEFQLAYTTFNYFEAAFWFALSIAVYFAGKKYQDFRSLSVFTAATLMIFGISDIAEVQIGNFLEPGMEWLFAIKALCVVALLASLARYLSIRARQKNK